MPLISLKCPVCGSWYTGGSDPHWIGGFWRIGMRCNNQAGTGPHPELCSPKHPCKGRLEYAGDFEEEDPNLGVDFFSDRKAIEASFKRKKKREQP